MTRVIGRLHGTFPAPTTLVAIGAGLLLAGCGSVPMRTTKTPSPVAFPVQGPSAPTPGVDGFPDVSKIPPNVAETPDAVPKVEPRSASGNPISYEVFGKTYTLLHSAEGFKQEGYASWYGKKFQGRRTASGEPYDMFKMTAAHKRLPIPSYARVTDLENGKSVVVRINDRGPFHHGRIIDLSYAAAARLGMLKHGSTKVEVEALVPTDTTPDTLVASEKSSSANSGTQIPAAYHPAETTLYLQLGVFTDPINAVELRDRLHDKGVAPLLLRSTTIHRAAATQVLIGPFNDQRARQAMRAQLRAQQIPAQPVER